MKINKYISIWISLAIISFSGITIAAETNDSMKGMELYNSKCKKCHGAEAKGKKFKKKPDEFKYAPLRYISAEKLNEALVKYRKMWQQKTYTKAEITSDNAPQALSGQNIKSIKKMAKATRSLTDENISFIVSYISSLTASEYNNWIKSLQLESGGGSASETLYNFKTTALFRSAEEAKANSKGEGRLMPATKVKVLERKGDWLKVAIDGWQQDRVNRVIYQLQGKRIFSAVLSRNLTDRIVINSKMLDEDTDLSWNQVTLVAWTSAKDLIPSADKIWDFAESMFSSSCTACHSPPETDHFLANQWLGNLKTMKRFINLNKEQYYILHKYLQLRAKDTHKETAALQQKNHN